jgi:hypothetical protein
VVLFAASVYLIQKGKHYFVAFIPATACTLIVFGYILQAPEGLMLPSMIANAISIIATGVIAILFLKKYRKTSSDA